MRVNDNTIPHEGAQRCVLAGSPWPGGNTTWGVPHPRHLMWGLMQAKQASGENLRQLRGVSIQPWVWGSENLEGGGGASSARYREHLQIVCSFRRVQASLKSMGRMAGKNPFDGEDNHNGYPPLFLKTNFSFIYI